MNGDRDCSTCIREDTDCDISSSGVSARVRYNQQGRMISHEIKYDGPEQSTSTVTIEVFTSSSQACEPSSTSWFTPNFDLADAVNAIVHTSDEKLTAKDSAHSSSQPVRSRNRVRLVGTSREIKRCDWCTTAVFESGQGLRFHRTIRCPNRFKYLGELSVESSSVHDKLATIHLSLPLNRCEVFPVFPLLQRIHHRERTHCPLLSISLVNKLEYKHAWSLVKLIHQTWGRAWEQQVNHLRWFVQEYTPARQMVEVCTEHGREETGGWIQKVRMKVERGFSISPGMDISHLCCCDGYNWNGSVNTPRNGWRKEKIWRSNLPPGRHGSRIVYNFHRIFWTELAGCR